MELTGRHWMAGDRSRFGVADWRAFDPLQGVELEPAYGEATAAEVDVAATAALAAMPDLRPRATRAALLEAIAEGILALGPELLARAHAESGLPMARLESERGRTVGQLRLLASVVREGSFLGLRIDHADPARQPIPKPDLRRMLIPLGPVAVFGASNFPLAFSVAGGDTASALAAGCPVVHKAHPAHPGTAELVGGAIAAAVAKLGLPGGVFSLVHGRGHEVGLALARHPAIAAIGFTGSLRGGRALFDAAAARPVPIPVYAEMGSVNPLFFLPRALEARGAELATGFAGSVTLGTGQFCTNPGLFFVVDDDAGRAFVAALGEKLAAAPAGAMLYPALRPAYERGVAQLASLARRATPATSVEGACAVSPCLLTTDAATFRAHAELAEEVFGPSTLGVLCRDVAEMAELAAALPGQLTAGIHGEAADADDARELLEVLAAKAGRVLWGGFPTGVEVAHAMQHGGPYPATTDSRSTSVGTAAVERFLRPVTYQNVPEGLLPEELRDDAQGLWRLVDGDWRRG